MEHRLQAHCGLTMNDSTKLYEQICFFSQDYEYLEFMSRRLFREFGEFTVNLEKKQVFTRGNSATKYSIDNDRYNTEL